MARQILPIVGAVVGGIYGGAAGAQAGWALGSVIGGVVDPVVNKGPSLGDLPAQTSYEGSPRAIVFGTSTCIGYVAAFGEPIKSTERQGGGKGGPETEFEVVHRSYAIAICEGPIGGVLRVWENDKLVYDVRQESEMLEESAEWISEGNKRFYLGGEEQLPDPMMELKVTDEGELPGFSGTAWMRVIDEDLTDTRGAIPQYRFEVSQSKVGGGLAVYIALDRSGSMSDLTDNGKSRWENAREAMVSFLNRLKIQISFGRVDICFVMWGGVPENDLYRESITIRGASTEDIDSIISSIPILIEKGWGTVFTSASADANTFFLGTSSEQRRVSIFVSDGLPSSWYNGGWEPGTIESIGKAHLAGNELLGVDEIQAYAFSIDLEDTTYTSLMDNTPDDGVPVIDGSNPNEIAIALERVFTIVPGELGDVIGSLHLRSGLGVETYDMSEISSISIKGMTLQSDGYTASDAISQLQGCYFFDKQEPGDKIYYPLRGKPVVATLTIDDLVEVPDLSRREQASEIPKKVNLMYQNALAGYAPVKATFSASSPDNKSVLEVTTQVAVVLDVDEAARMVNKMFKAISADAQGEIKFTVPDKFIRFVPGDCVGLALRGRVIRLRIEGIEWADGQLSLTCRTDRQSAYMSNVTGIEIPPSLTPPSTLTGHTEFAYLDIPARIDSEDDLNYLVAGTGALDGWRGWALQRSLDSGENFSTVDKWNDRGVMGTLVDPVDAASEHYTDTTNTVRVQLFRESQVIESITEHQFLSEGGAFAIVRSDGSAEVMQYLDADDEGDGVFALSTLHRGLLNTGGTSHAAGAMLVMLTSAKHIVAQSAWIGMDLVHRAVSLGASAETATTQKNPFVGRSQIEWPVAYLDVRRDGSDVLTGTWFPRHRFGSDVSPIASINFQGYRVTLDDGSTVVTLDTTTPSFTYDASTMSSPVTVSVASINRITGPGPTTSETA